MSAASIADLRTAAAWLEEYGGRVGAFEDEGPCLRVAEWLRYVVDQREEYAARTRVTVSEAVAAPPPTPLRLAVPMRPRDPEVDTRRMTRMKSAFEAVWRARSA